MITKTGSKMVKEALLGLAIGAYRADSLNENDRKALKEYYGLKDNASLTLRNAGRGTIGNGIGTVAGGMLGSALPGNAKALAPFLGLGGGIAGIKLMTDKYSKGNAKRVRGNSG